MRMSRSIYDKLSDFSGTVISLGRDRKEKWKFSAVLKKNFIKTLEAEQLKIFNSENLGYQLYDTN